MCFILLFLSCSLLCQPTLSVCQGVHFCVCACVCMCLGLNQSVVEFRGLVCPFFCGLLSDKMVKWQHQSADTSLTPQVVGQWKYNFTDKNWIAFYRWLDWVCIIFKANSWNFVCIIFCVVTIRSLFSNGTSGSQTSENQVEPGRLERSQTGRFDPHDVLKQKKTSFYFLSLMWLRPNSF